MGVIVLLRSILRFLSMDFGLWVGGKLNDFQLDSSCCGGNLGADEKVMGDMKLLSSISLERLEKHSVPSKNASHTRHKLGNQTGIHRSF